MRKYARELAIYRLKPVADQITELWAIAVSKKQPKPDPFACVRKVADAGFRLNTYMALHQYIRRCLDNNRHPEVRSIIITLLPWAAESSYLRSLKWDPPASPLFP